MRPSRRTFLKQAGLAGTAVLAGGTVKAFENGSSTPILIGSSARATAGARAAPGPAGER